MPAVLNLAELAMNGLRSSDNLSAMHVRQSLHPQADPKNGHTVCLLQKQVAGPWTHGMQCVTNSITQPPDR